jgi:3-oxoacyl-[acyl-carrier-protein] synthase II
MSGDAAIAAPSEDGDGPTRVMKNCLSDAGMGGDSTTSTHGTSTPLGDKAETMRSSGSSGAREETRDLLDRSP